MTRLASALRRVGAGAFGRLLLPAIILQSVLIGGGYATGREIVAYGAKYGAQGWIAVVAIFAGFTLMSVLTFEVARVFRAYEYKGFVRQIIGKAWPLFDVLYVAMAVLVIAIMASAASEILLETLGVPPLVGTGTIVAAVGVLSYFGAQVIEAFKSVGSVLLYLAFAAFGLLVLTQRWDAVAEVFATGNTAYQPDAGMAAVLGSGVLYVGYNLAVYPPVLFTLHRQRSRKDSLAAGVLAGLLMTLPFALTYLCVMAFYPMPRILDAPVPWLGMLAAVGGGGLVGVYGAVMGWTLLETSIGMIHAILDRVDRNLEGAEAGPLAGMEGLSRLQRGLLGAGILIAAAVLSRVGIITLVADGYTVMAYLFIALFALPLLTVGTVRILNPGWRPFFLR